MKVGDFVAKGDLVGQIMMIDEGMLSVKVDEDYFTWEEEEVTLKKKEEKPVTETKKENPIAKPKKKAEEEGWSAGRMTKVSALALGVFAMLGL